MYKYNFYKTPGHGYLKVPLTTDVLEIISNYSYIDVIGYIYAEEDCDMKKVMDLLKITNYQIQVIFDQEEKFKETACRKDQLTAYDIAAIYNVYA